MRRRWPPWRPCRGDNLPPPRPGFAAGPSLRWNDGGRRAGVHEPATADRNDDLAAARGDSQIARGPAQRAAAHRPRIHRHAGEPQEADGGPADRRRDPDHGDADEGSPGAVRQGARDPVSRPRWPAWLTPPGLWL